MNLMTWNVRGFNEPKKQVEVKRLLANKLVNVVGLLETSLIIGTKSFIGLVLNGVGVIIMSSPQKGEFG